MLFTGSRDGELRRGDFHRETAWTKTVVKVVLPGGFHFHDLRRTGNQLAAMSGASTRELTRRMGHGSMRAAMIYQHAGDERDRAIADRLGQHIEGERSAETDGGDEGQADEDEGGDEVRSRPDRTLIARRWAVAALDDRAICRTSPLTCTGGVERATGIEPA